MRKNGGVRGNRGRSLTHLLLERIEQCDIKSPTVDQIVDFLQSTYSEYRRLNLKKYVEDALRLKNSRKSKSTLTNEDDEINSDKSSQPLKKLRLADTASSYESFSTGIDGIDLIKDTLRQNYIEKGKSNVKEEKINGNSWPKFKDIGGINDLINKLNSQVLIPLRNPELPQHLGVKPMAGILLYGPTGCGKTQLACAIANETDAKFYEISSGSEENIQEVFNKAYRTSGACIVFIDEIDTICSKRENVNKESDRRKVTQLIKCMDYSYRKKYDNESLVGYVLVIGVTNKIDAIDPALKSSGRFDWEFEFNIPNENARFDILSKISSTLKLEGDFDFQKIANSTHGFVGADLKALTDKAGNLAMDRFSTEQCLDIEKLKITMSDFEEAVKLVKPSSTRQGRFNRIPNVKWENIGGLKSVREVFDQYIMRPIKYPKLYEELGLDMETGFLLYGPPGCGKTLIAKAIATECGLNFIHIKGPEILNKFVGESEKAIRKIFDDARKNSPCVIFFDEVDSLTTKRGREGGLVVESVLTQLLVELDGGEKLKDVYVIAATNRPEVMDPAVLRPGRLGKHIYIPLPNPDERGLILKTISKNKPIDPNVDLMAIAKDKACENLSGADLDALVNDAGMAALSEQTTFPPKPKKDGEKFTIKESHFKQALKKVVPSVSEEQRLHYERLARTFGGHSMEFNDNNNNKQESLVVSMDQ